MGGSARVGVALALGILVLAGSGCPGSLPERRDGSAAAGEGPGAESGLLFADGGKDAAATADTRAADTRAADTRADRSPPASGKSCKEVLDCMGQCKDIACGTICLGAACAPASQLAQSLYTCAMQKCINECVIQLIGTCQTCLATKCADLYKQCASHTSCSN
jgi:hypothetical protein